MLRGLTPAIRLVLFLKREYWWHSDNSDMFYHLYQLNYFLFQIMWHPSKCVFVFVAVCCLVCVYGAPYKSKRHSSQLENVMKRMESILRIAERERTGKSTNTKTDREDFLEKQTPLFNDNSMNLVKLDKKDTWDDYGLGGGRYGKRADSYWIGGGRYGRSSNNVDHVDISDYDS